MLDLASEMLAGATMEDVSTVLYFKVLQWAGYSRNLKVAAFERLVEKDGRTDELYQLVAEAMPGATWDRVQNNPLAIDGLIPNIAYKMYPALFPEAKSFSSSTEGFSVRRPTRPGDDRHCSVKEWQAEHHLYRR